MKFVKIAIAVMVAVILGGGVVGQFRENRSGIGLVLPPDQAALVVVACSAERCPGRLANKIDDLPKDFEDLKDLVKEDFGDLAEFKYVVLNSRSLASLEQISFCAEEFSSTYQMSLIIYTSSKTRIPLNFTTRSRLAASIGAFHYSHEGGTMAPCGITSWIPTIRFSSALWSIEP